MKSNPFMKGAAVVMVGLCGAFAFAAFAEQELQQELCVHIFGEAPGVSCQPILAGQDIEAGEVCFVIEGGNLYVTYHTMDGWELTETHLWVGDDLDLLPVNPGGNPVPGQFPHKSGDITGATQYTHEIPLAPFLPEDGIDCGAVDEVVLLVAAHAALQRVDEDGEVIQTETGWGDGDPITERGSWATFFGIVITCCDDEGGGGEPGCETAFAYDAELGTCFLDLGFNRWGWTIGRLGLGEYVFDIYAAAGQCDIDKGTLVGRLTVEYDGATAVVTYNMDPGFSMSETHLYVGNDPLPGGDNPTVAPGQYPYKDEHDPHVMEFSYTVEDLEGAIYVVAHAVVCSLEFAD